MKFVVWILKNEFCCPIAKTITYLKHSASFLSRPSTRSSMSSCNSTFCSETYQGACPLLAFMIFGILISDNRTDSTPKDSKLCQRLSYAFASAGSPVECALKKLYFLMIENSGSELLGVPALCASDHHLDFFLFHNAVMNTNSAEPKLPLICSTA